MSACTVLIAARELIDPLRRTLAADGELLTFSDSEPLRALEAIVERRPTLVALEQVFASSPRGTALINRIKSDPVLCAAEVVILSHSRHPSRTIHRWQPPPVKQPSEQKGTRKAARFRIRPGIDVLVDGSPAVLIDLSLVGAQILSPATLRPNTRVRLTLAEEDDAMRISGTIVWARFEIPTQSGEPNYRAGVQFADADPAKVNRFCDRWKL